MSQSCSFTPYVLFQWTVYRVIADRQLNKSHIITVCQYDTRFK